MAARCGRPSQRIEPPPGLEGTGDLAVFVADDIRAVLSTPLVSRDGRLVGMLNNHFRVPHRPAEHELRLLDLLARMASDWIERSQVEEALRQSEQRFAAIFNQAAGGIAVADPSGRVQPFQGH